MSTDTDSDDGHVDDVIDDDDGVLHNTRSGFDAFFSLAASSSRTSANVFSARVLPLTQEEYTQSIADYDARTPKPATRWSGHLDARTAFRRWARELDEGFNLVFYGFGSKRSILNDFATNHLSRRGHVVVVNGFHPSTVLKDVLSSIERLPALADAAPATSNADAQIRRIYAFFATADAPRTRRLFLVIHNIDAPPMRAPKMKNALSLLALCPNIHLAVSVDRLGAPLLWSASELLARKVPPLSADDATSTEGHSVSPKRGYTFLWHDLTTLAPYDTELAFADRSSISGASYATTGSRASLAATAGAGSGHLTETAVAHVLAAVTAKAKKLFALLGTKQLANIEASSDAQPSTDMAQFGLGFDVLFSSAREDFVASSDTALRALLGEFRDHGLILTGPGGGGAETLWIPLRKERLVKVLKSIEDESS